MKHSLRKLPKRSDKYLGLRCSGRSESGYGRCCAKVGFQASYDQAGSRAHRNYCRGCAKRFAARYGLKIAGK
jgi:hypothetical protein